MAIPQQLDEWNYDIIQDYVEKGYLETNTFEFKASIKSSNPTDNMGIVETTCAFANTEGGFIIFGVEDIRKSDKDRIIGVRNSDLAKEFGDRISGINPTVDFDFSNPPIKIPGKDTVIFITQIKKSDLRPHIKVDVGKFFFRTNKGNKQMSYEQIKQEFLNYEERLNQINLLYIELLSNLTIAENLEEDTSEETTPTDIGFRTPMYQFDTTVISSIIPKIFTLLSKDKSIIELLIRLRIQLEAENRGLHHYRLKMFNPQITRQNMKLNETINNIQVNMTLNKYIIPSLKKALARIEKEYQIKNPLPDEKFVIYKEE